jgi:hypothetical protein
VCERTASQKLGDCRAEASREGGKAGSAMPFNPAFVEPPSRKKLLRAKGYGAVGNYQLSATSDVRGRAWDVGCRTSRGMASR